jgi:hypothetical protein
VQLRTLLGLLRRAAATPFGIHHDFPRIRTLADFQRLVPVRTPLELARELERPLQLPAPSRLPPPWPAGPASARSCAPPSAWLPAPVRAADC